MSKSIWNEILLHFPSPHLLQSREWAELKSRYGWQPSYHYWKTTGEPIKSLAQDGPPQEIDQVQAAAMVLTKQLPLGMSMLYVPKGPLLKDWGDRSLRDQVLGDLRSLAQEGGAALVKIDPDVRLGVGVPGKDEAEDNPLGEQVSEHLKSEGWTFSPDQVQYRNTMVVDLTPDEEQLLMNMKSKTRYNIRLAGRKGVTVRIGGPEDLDRLYTMYAKTSLRGGFAIRDREYYQELWRLFWGSGNANGPGPAAQPLIAEVEGEPVAGAVMFRFGKTAYYLQGMSRTKHREKMPTYLIQWESMRWAKQAGCTAYDMWGAPDRFDRGDPMWGVYRFKRGFGGQVIRTLGAWDYPSRTVPYRLYTRVWPRVLDVWRWLGELRTQDAAQA